MSDLNISMTPVYATEERVALLSDRQHELWTVQQRNNELQAELNARHGQLVRALVLISGMNFGLALGVFVVLLAIR